MEDFIMCGDVVFHEKKAVIFPDPYLSMPVQCEQKFKDLCALMPDFLRLLETREHIRSCNHLILEIAMRVAQHVGSECTVQILDEKMIQRLSADLEKIIEQKNVTPDILTYINVRILGCMRV